MRLRPRVILKSDTARAKNFTAPSGSDSDPPKDNRGDGPLEKIIKYIPGEVLVAYLAINSVLVTQRPLSPIFEWGVYLFMVGAAVLWMIFAARDRRAGEPIAWDQTVVAGLATAAWGSSFGEPFRSTFPGYQAWMSTVAGIMITVMAPIIGGIFRR